MLEDLIRKVEGTPLTEKDPEAEELLAQGMGRDPDAMYKLAQTVLVQNLALNQARAQIQQLQQAQQQAQPLLSTSFLGSLLGRDPAPAPPAQPPYQPVPYQQVPAYQAAPQYSSAPPYAAPAPSPGGSFLRSAATTAAGVAAGALAFEGIESLMHGFGHEGGGWGAGGWGGGGFGSGAPAVEETVINNYYDDPKQAGGFAEHHEHEASYDDRPEGHADLKDADYKTDRDSSSDDDSTDDDSTDDFDSDFGSGDDFS